MSVFCCVGSSHPSDECCCISIEMEEGCCVHSESVWVDLRFTFPIGVESLDGAEVDVGVLLEESDELSDCV